MSMKWLDNAPQTLRGINWGTPWTNGALDKNEVSHLQLSSSFPVQNKIMAVWPDGSVKWTGHSAIFPANADISNLDLSIDHKLNAKQSSVMASESYDGITVDNDVMTLFFPFHNERTSLVDWIKIGTNKKLTDLKLIAKVDGVVNTAQISKTTIEENGPVKAVIKIEAILSSKGQPILKYEIRFRIYRQLSQLEIIHTMTIIKPVPISGLGLTYSYPVSGDPWNRQIKFVGDDGVYCEPAQLAISRRYRYENQQYEKQAAGEMIEFESEDADKLQNAQENAIWNNFFIAQNTFNSYELSKQTDADHYRLTIGYGQHSKGTFYSGGTNGGIAASIENFWQKTPSKFSVLGLNDQLTKNVVWFWSDDAQPMDFRHYSDHGHEVAYEGMNEVRATAEGVGNTSRVWLNLFDQPASNDQIMALAIENVHPAQIVMAPQDYYDTQVFGVWSLPNRTSSQKNQLEDQLLALRNFYLREVEQQGWYGYWNYGDVMHTYDRNRHVWCYDFGGYAWQNTELMVNIWLWLDFVRTGDKEAYYFAEAMTRHTSEVDQYHSGEYKGLGSRHNVEHWGDSCKEVRISEAGLQRYYYYLSADERIGEIMTDVKDVENFAFDELPPMRSYFSDHRTNPFLIRTGPDWVALSSNWFTEFERTGNHEYFDRINNGIDCIYGMPDHLLSGPVMEFDKNTKLLQYYGTGNTHGYHMMISFGAPEFWLEFIKVFKNDKLRQMVAEFGRFYALTDDQKKAESNGKISNQHMAWPMFATALMAFASQYYQDPQLAKKAWHILTTPEISGMPLDIKTTEKQVVNWKNVQEMPWISTNVVSQWCLNVILTLELIPDYLD